MQPPQATFWDGLPDEGGQAEAIRVPLANGTLVKLPVEADSALIPSLLTLSDVFGTGYHAAHVAGVGAGKRVTVIGDGAVGLLSVLSAQRLGAEQIVLMGRHKVRTDLGREFGATDVVSARGEDGIAQVRELTGGHGTHVVIEAVGALPAYEQAVGIVRPGGVISRVGVPQYEEAPIGFGSLFGPNVRLAGGPAPVRAYIEELMPDILDRLPVPDLVEQFHALLARATVVVAESTTTSSRHAPPGTPSGPHRPPPNATSLFESSPARSA